MLLYECIDNILTFGGCFAYTVFKVWFVSLGIDEIVDGWVSEVEREREITTCMMCGVSIYDL